MKRIILFLLVFIIYGCPETTSQKLTVATFNVRYENSRDSIDGNGWYQRCPIICGLILFHDFEIFGAQEVLHDQLLDMLNWLPGYSYVGVGRDDGKTRGEYAPIFYKKDKFEILKSGHFWLSEHSDYPNKGWDAVLPRICTWARFKNIENGFEFFFFNLHMDHVGIKAREKSAELVLAKIKQICGNIPVVLTGDFNVDQNSAVYDILENSYLLEDAYEVADIRYALNGTFNNFKIDRKTDSRIDHIFVSPFFRVERYGVLTDTYRAKAINSMVEKSENFPKEVSLTKFVARTPSDHFPVKVVLSF